MTLVVQNLSVARAGQGRPGAVTMQDVAAALGLSRSTVSLALRDRDVIAVETRERVQAAAAELGYVYNRSAANLRTRRRDVVGLVVPGITNPLVGEVALGLQQALAGSGLIVALSN